MSTCSAPRFPASINRCVRRVVCSHAGLFFAPKAAVRSASGLLLLYPLPYYITVAESRYSLPIAWLQALFAGYIVVLAANAAAVRYERKGSKNRSGSRAGIAYKSRESHSYQRPRY
jgi:hypothetical protein